MTALLLLASTFALVLFKLAPDATGWQIAAYLADGPLLPAWPLTAT